MRSERPTLRVARPTDRLAILARQYENGLGFVRLGGFVDHAGFDGVMLGHPQHPWHLEFIQEHGKRALGAPSGEHRLVFYLPEQHQWQQACERAESAGFRSVSALNPYWETAGRTYEDVDGYRIVLQNAAWTL